MGLQTRSRIFCTEHPRSLFFWDFFLLISREPLSTLLLWCMGSLRGALTWERPCLNRGAQGSCIGTPGAHPFGRLHNFFFEREGCLMLMPPVNPSVHYWCDVYYCCDVKEGPSIRAPWSHPLFKREAEYFGPTSVKFFWEKLANASREPLGTLLMWCTLLLWCAGSLRGALYWAHIMQRSAIHSDDC